MKNFSYISTSVFLITLSCSLTATAADLIQLSPQLTTTALEPVVTKESLQKIAPSDLITPVIDPQLIDPTLTGSGTSGTATTEPGNTGSGSTVTDPKTTIEPLIPIKPNLDLPKERLPQDKNSQDQKTGQTDWPERIQSMFTEYWVQLLALIVSVIGVILAVSGFSLANKQKRKYLRKYLHEIDNVYASFKWKSRRCEVELYRLQDQVEEQLKAGKIDENTFHLLESRIQKYLDEMREADTRPPRDPAELHDQLTNNSSAKDLKDQIDRAGKAL